MARKPLAMSEAQACKVLGLAPSPDGRLRPSTAAAVKEIMHQLVTDQRTLEARFRSWPAQLTPFAKLSQHMERTECRLDPRLHGQH